MKKQPLDLQDLPEQLNITLIDDLKIRHKKEVMDQQLTTRLNAFKQTSAQILLIRKLLLEEASKPQDSSMNYSLLAVLTKQNYLINLNK